MKEVLLQEARGSHPDCHEKMLVTIFYPDATYGAQLVGVFHRAVAGLGEMEALDPRPWRLDVLQWPEMQAEATRDIANSRIVVVPADDAYASSEFFRRWVETWPAALDGPRLLLVPRRGAANIPPRVRQFVQWLEEICTQKGMDIAEDASREDIRAAFRRRALELHPDRSGMERGPFQEVQEAYSVLSDPERRSRYDQERPQPTAKRPRWGPKPEPVVPERQPAGH